MSTAASVSTAGLVGSIYVAIGRSTAFAEYISADPKSLVKIPPGVSFEAASFAACVLSTVVRGVRKIGVKPGMRVLVCGLFL